MKSPYDIITINKKDLEMFMKDKRRSKIGILINIVLSELPQQLKPSINLISSLLKPIPGFIDKNVVGYEIKIIGDDRVDRFVKSYIPFFICKKESKE